MRASGRYSATNVHAPAPASHRMPSTQRSPWWSSVTRTPRLSALDLRAPDAAVHSCFPSSTTLCNRSENLVRGTPMDPTDPCGAPATVNVPDVIFRSTLRPLGWTPDCDGNECEFPAQRPDTAAASSTHDMCKAFNDTKALGVYFPCTVARACGRNSQHMRRQQVRGTGCPGVTKACVAVLSVWRRTRCWFHHPQPLRRERLPERCCPKLQHATPAPIDPVNGELGCVASEERFDEEKSAARFRVSAERTVPMLCSKLTG